MNMTLVPIKGVPSLSQMSRWMMTTWHPLSRISVTHSRSIDNDIEGPKGKDRCCLKKVAAHSHKRRLRWCGLWLQQVGLEGIL